MRQACRYSIGAMPISRLKRSKKAERDMAASRASSATLQREAGCSCRRRSAAASFGSPSPRTSPGEAAVPEVERSASISSTSSSRSSTISRAGRSARDSSLIICTRVESRRSPRTQIHRGSRDTSNAASGEPNRHTPTSIRTSTAPCGSPTRAPPGIGTIGVAMGSPSRGGSRSRLEVAKPRAAGIMAKSPSSSVIVSSWPGPSTRSRQRPSSTTK